MRTILLLSIVLTRLNPGDDAMVKIWNLISGKAKQEISCAFHGPIGAIAWVDLGEGLDRAFVFGCCDGTLHLYVWDDETVRDPCW